MRVTPGGTATGSSQATVQQLAAESALHLEDLLDRVVPLLVAAEPDGFFDESGAADLRKATSAGLRSLLAVLGGDRADDHLAVAAGAGRRQIQQALPLEGVLRAYRPGRSRACRPLPTSSSASSAR